MFTFIKNLFNSIKENENLKAKVEKLEIELQENKFLLSEMEKTNNWLGNNIDEKEKTIKKLEEKLKSDLLNALLKRQSTDLFDEVETIKENISKCLNGFEELMNQAQESLDRSADLKTEVENLNYSVDEMEEYLRDTVSTIESILDDISFLED